MYAVSPLAGTEVPPDQLAGSDQSLGETAAQEYVAACTETGPAARIAATQPHIRTILLDTIHLSTLNSAESVGNTTRKHGRRYDRNPNHELGKTQRQNATITRAEARSSGSRRGHKMAPGGKSP
jgi:hypothetical protein